VRRADRVTAVVLLVLGAGFAAGALRYPYWTPAGPGSGFLPLWLGLALGLLALGLLASATRATDPGPPWLPAGRGLVRIGAVLVATGLFVALIPVLGMAAGTVLFLVAVLRVLEGHGWAATAVVALGTATANWLVFAHWLRVPFPVGVLGF
jgi:putative tricarboxylic transport membrane protein